MGAVDGCGDGAVALTRRKRLPTAQHGKFTGNGAARPSVAIALCRIMPNSVLTLYRRRRHQPRAKLFRRLPKELHLTLFPQGNVTASSSVLHSWDDKGNQIPFSLNVLNINSLDVRTEESGNTELAKD